MYSGMGFDAFFHRFCLWGIGALFNASMSVIPLDNLVRVVLSGTSYLLATSRAVSTVPSDKSYVLHVYALVIVGPYRQSRLIGTPSLVVLFL